MKKKNNNKKPNIFLRFCIADYRTIKYICYGVAFPFVFTSIFINKNFINKEVDVEKLKKESQKIYEKDKKKSLKNKDKTKKDDKTENYINEDIVIKKKTLGDFFKIIFGAFIAIPKSIKNKYNHLSVVKEAKNRKAFDTKTMLVNYETDAENDNRGKKIPWEYIAINEKGKKIKGYFVAYSRLDVQNFLLGEGLSVYSVRTNKMIQILHGNVGGGTKRIKNKDLIFLLSQLSTYLKSGIPLVESLNILIRQTKKKALQNILRDVTYDLTVGESFSVSLEKRGNAFPKLLINMVKAAELTGELPETLDDMVNYYTETEEARKEMISALTYPSIVFVFTLAVVTFILIYVVPKFVDIYKTMDSSEIPSFTQTVINVSNFIQNNFVFIILGIVGFSIVFALLYKYVQKFRIFIQWILMHIPVINNVIIYNEVTMFSKTFASLLSHNVYITQSIDILKKITNNEFYKMMMFDTIANLARGDKISTAFKDQWAFPTPAYEMIVTGEKTGQLAEMMSKVSTYYQSLHKNIVSRVKSLVEPILIIFLTFTVGAILLAVIIPMFNMYQQVQNLG